MPQEVDHNAEKAAQRANGTTLWEFFMITARQRDSVTKPINYMPTLCPLPRLSFSAPGKFFGARQRLHLMPQLLGCSAVL